MTKKPLMSGFFYGNASGPANTKGKGAAICYKRASMHSQVVSFACQ
ncbi:hypothetical protein [Peribacillus sp. NPDC058075]